MKDSTTRRRGFTLIEAMIAVTIVAISIAGPLYSASRSLVAAQIARDRLVASYLAQEGIEYVRAMRDDAYLHSYPANTANAWADFTTGASTWSMTPCVTATCTLDPTLPMGHGGGWSLQTCGGATNPACTPLYLTAAGTYSEQVVGTKTLFTRTIQATNVTVTDATITSTVTWSSHGATYSTTVTDHLTPWQ